MEIQGASEENVGTELFALDTVPDRSSDGVKDWLKKLPGIFMAHQILLILKNAGRYQHVATNASAVDANVLVKTQEALFSILKLMDAVSLMLQNFQSGANNILEKLKVAYLYLLDGFADFAVRDIEAISKDIKSMKTSTERAQKAVEQSQGQMQDIRMMSPSKDHDALVAEIDKRMEELGNQYRRVSEESWGEPSMEIAEDSSGGTKGGTRASFADFMWVNTKPFFLDWVSILITICTFASFYVCDCYLKARLCGGLILVLCFVLFACRFILIRFLKPDCKDYKPVIPIIIMCVVAPLFSCQLISLCDHRCFVGIAVAPLPIGVFYLWYKCSPNHWFFEVSNYTPLFRSGKSREELQKEQAAIKDEIYELATEKQLPQSRSLNNQLTKCYVGKASDELKSISGIVQQLTEVVATWYKECKDVVEPSMSRTIRKADGVAVEDKEQYWNSVAFKREVVGYYCRWQALQVYCETLRTEVRAKRAEIEARYTRSPYPKEAIKEAWQMASEDTADPEVSRLVREHEEMLKEGNGHNMSKLVKDFRNTDDVSLDIPEKD